MATPRFSDNPRYADLDRRWQQHRLRAYTAAFLDRRRDPAVTPETRERLLRLAGYYAHAATQSAAGFSVFRLHVEAVVAEGLRPAEVSATSPCHDAADDEAFPRDPLRTVLGLALLVIMMVVMECTAYAIVESRYGPVTMTQLMGFGGELFLRWFLLTWWGVACFIVSGALLHRSGQHWRHQQVREVLRGFHFHDLERTVPDSDGPERRRFLRATAESLCKGKLERLDEALADTRAALKRLRAMDARLNRHRVMDHNVQDDSRMRLDRLIGRHLRHLAHLTEERDRLETMQENLATHLAALNLDDPEPT